jgi:hypothetical protein
MAKLTPTQSFAQQHLASPPPQLVAQIKNDGTVLGHVKKYREWGTTPFGYAFVCLLLNVISERIGGECTHLSGRFHL